MEIKELVGKLMPFAGILILMALIGYAISNASGNGGGNAPKIDEDAPDFTLPSVEGGMFTLSEMKGKRNVLLYFQEGIMCPACWQQQVDMEMRKAEFDAMDIEMVMITVDPPDALANAKRGYGIRSMLLYDNELKASRLYNVLQDSMHPGERPGHVFVLIDKQGKVRWYFSAYKPTGTDSHGHPSGGTMYVPVTDILSSIKTAL